MQVCPRLPQNLAASARRRFPGATESMACGSAALDLQAKLSVGTTDDPAEQEADAVAARVVSRIRRRETAIDSADSDRSPTKRIERRDVRSREDHHVPTEQPTTRNRLGRNTIRRDGDESSESRPASPPDFNQPVTAAQVKMFPLQAVQQMRNNDDVCTNIHKTAFASS